MMSEETKCDSCANPSCELCDKPSDELCGDGVCRACHVDIDFEECVEDDRGLGWWM